MASLLMPGCNNMLMYTRSMKRLGEYLAEKGAIDGIAGCCKPSNTAYQEIPEGTDLIVICNTCSAIANESLGCHSVTHAFDIILNDDDFTYPDYDGEEITVQDCWRARGNHELHDAVRELLRHMNFDIVELEENRDSSRFCGTATLMPLPQTSMEFAPQQLGDHDPSLFVSHSEEDRRRLMREHVSKITTPRVVSYCTVCDKGLTLGGADSASLINLLFDTLMLPQS